MAQAHDEFEALIQASYSSWELAQLSGNLGECMAEPMTPSREDFLAYFDGFLEVVVGEENIDAIRIYKNQFFESLKIGQHIAYGTETRVSRVASYVTDDGTNKFSWVFTGNGDVVGKFRDMVIKPWYDIASELRPRDEKPFLRPHGLFVVLSNGKAVQTGGEIQELGETTYVPLSHGKPELFRILR
ncbi:MAG: hypothetical protein V4702_05255 [Patescibacteria group bacterium]